MNEQKLVTPLQLYKIQDQIESLRDSWNVFVFADSFRRFPIYLFFFFNERIQIVNQATVVRANNQYNSFIYLKYLFESPEYGEKNSFWRADDEFIGRPKLKERKKNDYYYSRTVHMEPQNEFIHIFVASFRSVCFLLINSRVFWCGETNRPHVGIK